jgi:hypothetical protein
MANEFLKKRRNEHELQELIAEERVITNNKKMRLDDVVRGIKDISKKIVEKNLVPLSEKKSILKVNSTSQGSISKMKNGQNITVSNYFENRLNSMSHIKQINPLFRNFIIPVLPGAFNKN